jgi:transposase InsO family protein
VLTVLPDEERAEGEYRTHHGEVGYRKLTWIMNDAGIAALSESAVYTVRSKHNLLGPWSKRLSDAEDEYRHKPSRVPEHWHTDIAYVKVSGIFYFLVMLLGGYSRSILGGELLTDRTSRSVQDFIPRVREHYPGGTPKLIHDNGSASVSREFKALVSRLHIQQVHTRRNHPETNGKIERLNGTVRQEALRVTPPSSFAEAEAVIGDFVKRSNNQRLHAGITFLRPADLFEGRGAQILAQRKQRLENARTVRLVMNKQRREAELQKIIQ